MEESIIAINMIMIEQIKTNTNILFFDEEFSQSILLDKMIDLMCNTDIPKNENFYEVIIPRYDGKTFQTHFRVSLDSFHFILDKIQNCSELLKKNQDELGGRDQINPEKALLIALWTLATPESYRSIGDRFGVTKSSVFYCVHTIVHCVNKYLCPIFIKWPSDIEKIHVADSFSKYGLKYVLGAIDGCHIPIKRPEVNGSDYYNRKKIYSVVLQGVCTYNLMFIDVDVRWPGSVHDARVFRTSDLYPIGSALCSPNYYLLGDCAYPCKKWLMTPFKNTRNLQEAQIHYNKILSKTRVKIEHAFGLLKGRFRRIRELLDMRHIENINATIIACCVLHNICLLRGELNIDQYIREGLEINIIEEIHYGNYFLEDDEGTEMRNRIVAELQHQN